MYKYKHTHTRTNSFDWEHTKRVEIVSSMPVVLPTYQRLVHLFGCLNSSDRTVIHSHSCTFFHAIVLHLELFSRAFPTISNSCPTTTTTFQMFNFNFRKKSADKQAKWKKENRKKDRDKKRQSRMIFWWVRMEKELKCAPFFFLNETYFVQTNFRKRKKVKICYLKSRSLNEAIKCK